MSYCYPEAPSLRPNTQFHESSQGACNSLMGIERPGVLFLCDPSSENVAYIDVVLLHIEGHVDFKQSLFCTTKIE